MGLEAPGQWTQTGGAEVRIKYLFFFSGSTQALFSALSPASAYLDVVANLEHRSLGEAMTLWQPGSQHPPPGKL